MKLKIHPYNDWHEFRTEEHFLMPKRKIENNGSESFGTRMARLRKEAGYSQRDLAGELGVSYRMIACYEAQTDYPPTHLLPQLATILGVTADQLLGIKRLKTKSKAKDNRLWRRFAQVEKLPASERKQIIKVLDAFLEREKPRKAQ